MTLRSRPSNPNLSAVLTELGIRTLGGPNVEADGFPLRLTLADGRELTLDLGQPALLSSLDPDEVGVAILDPLGLVKSTWGLATRTPHLQTGGSVLESPIAGLMDCGARGPHGALYLDGFRYYSTGLRREAVGGVFVLVVNALEEYKARRQASKGWRVANTLKRLGKALTMSQTRGQTCVAAAHEIASASDLAAVLIWTSDGQSPDLELTASVGVNRQGTQILASLRPDSSPSCVAELAGTSRDHIHLPNADGNDLTAGLEARFCYLKPGGVWVHPLIISDRLIGVLELIGKNGDPNFDDSLELFQTIAEHLALALNSATLYEIAEKRASHDALTGIANHRSMQEFLNARLAEATRNGTEIGIVMVDVDHFRSFNEEEGHETGDDVLKLVADALKTCVRPYDLAARYGGEEFTLVLTANNLENTIALAERVRAKVESISYITRSGRLRTITVSVGVAVFPHSAGDAAGLLRAADAALFKAKRAGRNRVEIFEGRFDARIPRPALDLDALTVRLREANLPLGDELWSQVEGDVSALVLEMGLSSTQALVLQGLILAYPAYREARRSWDPEALRAFEGLEEFRLLMPSLLSLDERSDGNGPRRVERGRIPVLAKVLQVLVAVAEEDSRALGDPGRLDPEILALLADIRHRAA